MNTGIPACYAKWYRSFLTDRRYTVKYGSTCSGYRRFANGVPQGSVSGPLLFIIYINSLSERLSKVHIGEDKLSHALFADDNTLWCRNKDARVAAAVVQKGLDVVSEWSKEYGMPILVGKNEAMLFSNYHGDFKNPPVMNLGEDLVAYSDSVRLLGVIIDKKLSFSRHVAKLKKECNRRLFQMRSVAGADWGGSCGDLRGLYIAYVRSLLECCSAAFSPLLTTTRKNELEIIQNKAARIMTGCVKATDIESLLLEANLLPLRVQYDVQAAIAVEKAARLPEKDPLNVLAMKAVGKSRRVNTGQSWKHRGDKALERLKCIVGRNLKNGGTWPLSKKDRESTTAVDIRNREEMLIVPRVAPWNTQKAGRILFFTDMDCAKTDPDHVKKRVTDDTVASRGKFDFEIWTDGSVIDKLGAGAGRITVTRTGTNYDVKAASGFLSSSFRAEGVALQVALQKVLKLKTLKLSGKSILIGSDSKSLIMALEGGPLSQGDCLLSGIWGLLIQLLEEREVSKVVFQFVYSHCGVVRNEMADKLAEVALGVYKKVDQRKVPISLQAVKAMVKQGEKEMHKGTLDVEKPRFQASGNAYTDLKRSGTFLRGQEILLAQLRTGECRLMGKWRSRLGIGDSRCRWCNEEEETVAHVYTNCSNLCIFLLRMELKVEDVKILHSKPEIGFTFYERALSILNK